jgi:hypothetical protein
MQKNAAGREAEKSKAFFGKGGAVQRASFRRKAEMSEAKPATPFEGDEE